VNDQHTVEYRKVELGPMIDGLRVIRDGLKPQDWVIVNGMQRVRPGAKVDPQQQMVPQDQARPQAEAAIAKS
jgi:multidrug efflux pump subunit AcrA (membrane-fusion protein)